MTIHTIDHACWSCGWLHDAASNVDGWNGAPAENDITLCTNCGAMSVWHGSGFVEPTEGERSDIMTEMGQQIAEAQALILHYRGKSNASPV